MNVLKYKCLHIVVCLLLGVLIAIPSNGQPEVVWQRLLDYTYSGSLIELPNGDLLLGADYLDEPNGIGLVRMSSDGTILEEYDFDNPEYIASNFELISHNNLLTSLRYESGQYCSFGVLDHEATLLFESDLILGNGRTTPDGYGGFVTGSRYDEIQDSSTAIITKSDSVGHIEWSLDYTDMFLSLDNVSVSVNSNIYAPISLSGYDIMGELFIKIISGEGYEISSIVFGPVDGLLNPHNSYFLPDGNLYLMGKFDLYVDQSYKSIILSPDGDLLETLSDYEVNSVHNEIHTMPDGGYLSFKGIPEGGMHEYVHTLRLRRFDASWNLLWSYDYENNQFNYDEFFQVTPVVTSEGEIVLFGHFLVFDPWPDVEVGTFITKLSSVPTDLEIDISPISNVHGVPAPGRINWHGALTNNTDADIVTDVWVIVRGPDGYPSEPLRVWEDITVPANGFYEADLQQNVPADAASGEYNYILRAGTYEPGDPQHTIQAYFPLTVTGGTEVNLDPPRTRGVVAAPFERPKMVELAPELKK